MFNLKKYERFNVLLMWITMHKKILRISSSFINLFMVWRVKSTMKSQIESTWNRRAHTRLMNVVESIFSLNVYTAKIGRHLSTSCSKFNKMTRLYEIPRAEIVTPLLRLWGAVKILLLRPWHSLSTAITEYVKGPEKNKPSEAFHFIVNISGNYKVY